MRERPQPDPMKLRVDDTHGDAYTVWTSQGSPAAPSAAQRAALVAAMEPALLEPVCTADASSGSLTIDFDLPRFGVSLITIAPANSASDAGGAGGAGPAPGQTSARSGCACETSRGSGGGGGALAVVMLAGLVSVARRRRRDELIDT